MPKRNAGPQGGFKKPRDGSADKAVRAPIWNPPWTAASADLFCCFTLRMQYAVGVHSEP